MFVPFEVLRDVYAEIFDGGGCRDVEAFGVGVGIAAAPYSAASEICVSAWFGKCD